MRSLVGGNPKRWEFIIPQAEFAYNHQVLNLLPLNNQVRVSMDAEEFAAHIKGIHDQVREHLEEVSKHYKFKAHTEGVKSLKKVILSWFIFGRKDFQLVLITS